MDGIKFRPRIARRGIGLEGSRAIWPNLKSVLYQSRGNKVFEYGDFYIGHC
jgi:hypothetical protein